MQQSVGRVLGLNLLVPDLRDRVVGSDRGLTHSDRDQSDLLRVARDIAGRKDARQVRLHRHRIDLELPLALELDPPLGDLAEVGVEAEQRDQSLALDALDLAGFRVLDRDALDRAVTVNLAHLAGGQNPHPPLRLQLAGLVDRSLERTEAVAPVDEGDRRACRVLETQRPVERRVPAADDHAILVLEDVLLPHEVVDALALPLVDPLDSELARLERPVSRGDDERARQVRPAFVRPQSERLLAVLADALERLRLFAEDLWVARDVVDVLFGIRRGDLPAELLEALDDANRRVAMTRVVSRREARRPRAEDRDVDEAVVGHGRKSSAGALLRAAAGAAAGFGRIVLGRRAFLDLERVPAPAARDDVRIVDRKATLEAFDEIDLGPHQIGRAERVHDDRDAVRVDLLIALLRGRVEAERILEARAAAALHRDAKNPRVARGLLGHQVLDLRRRRRGDRDESFLLDSGHRSNGSNVPPALHAPFRGRSL